MRAWTAPSWAISESQERMAVALAPQDVDRFIALAAEENLEATPVATVTEEKRLKMVWNGRRPSWISAATSSTPTARKSTRTSHIQKGTVWQPQWAGSTFGQLDGEAWWGDLNICSKKGLSERFDSTIGAATVLMPFGGSHQLTPPDGPWRPSCRWTARPDHLLGHGLGATTPI